LLVDGEELNVHQVYPHFRKLQIDSGIDDPIRFHDLRHTFASQFMMNSGNIYDLQKILGHYDVQMNQRYAHHSPEHLQKSIKFLGFGDVENSTNVLSIFKK
jgi:site-specific recombinase XerD